MKTIQLLMLLLAACFTINTNAMRIESDDGSTEYTKGIHFEDHHGENIKESLKKAFSWYKKAANKGHFNAQLKVAHWYYNGTGCQRDFKKAFSLYEQLAEQKSPEALAYLGHHYYYGHGTERDYDLAFISYSIAALDDDPLALLGLSSCYLKGNGTKEDVAAGVNALTRYIKVGKKLGKYRYIEVGLNELQKLVKSEKISQEQYDKIADIQH